MNRQEKNYLLNKKEIYFRDFHLSTEDGLICYWCPRHLDIRAVSRFFKLADCSSVLDAGCGFGFLSCLLAKEGLQIKAVDFTFEDSVFQHPNIHFAQEDIFNLKDCPDGVFCSWMPIGENLSPAFLKFSPKALVYVIETTGLTGDNQNRYLFDLYDNNYYLFSFWNNVCYLDFSESLFRFRSSIFKTSHNQVLLLLRKDVLVKLEDFTSTQEAINPYTWEEDLDKFYQVGEKLSEDEKILWKL